MSDATGPRELRAAAGLCLETLSPHVESDWSVPAGVLSWDVRRTVDHVADCMLFYATHLALRATTMEPWARVGGPPGSTHERLVGYVHSTAAVLAEVVVAAPASARGFHPAGRADPSGFAAMGTDEILVHTHDAAVGLGAGFAPPGELAASVVARLFPWAPVDADPWTTLLWCNGRVPLGDRPAPDPDWGWQCAPLDEWDGTVKRRDARPRWETGATTSRAVTSGGRRGPCRPSGTRGST